MFIPITNTPRDYAWGSTTAIADLLGREPSGRPEAELWFGSHPGSPSVVLDPAQTDGHATLAGWIQLPFLLKVLAAASPLSLQAHPTAEQARQGFARENAAGIPIDAPHRNYKDESAKPELIVALADGFEALCGFRDASKALEVFELIAHRGEGPAFEPLLQRLRGPDPIRTTFEWFVAHELGELAVLDNLCTAAAEAEATDHDRDEFAVVRTLAARFPGDPGIAVSVLLNHVRLAEGEALYLRAGNIHAYLSGLGVELMGSSDNVLRGGLTAKHVDVAELLSVLDFTSGPVPYIAAEKTPGGALLYRPADAEIAIARIKGGEVTLTPEGPAIILCTDGVLAVTGGTSSITLTRGEAALVLPDEGTLTLLGGSGFLAASRSR